MPLKSFQTTDSTPDPTTDSTPTEGQPDLLSEIGSEISVVVDRWSAGQIGLSELAVAAAILAAAGGGSFLVRRQARRLTAHLDEPAATAGLVIARLISLGIYLFAAGLILEVLGFTFGPVVIVALVVWTAVVFARPMLHDLNSGLALQLRGSLHIGDLVETNGFVGTVQGVSIHSVTLVTGDGKTVEIPSREVTDQALVNFSTLGRRRSEMRLSLPEGADAVEVADRLRTAVEGVGHVLDEPPPEALLTAFDGTGTSVTILYWHGPESWAERLATDRVARAVLELLTAEDIALSDPTIVVKGPDLASFRRTSAQ